MTTPSNFRVPDFTQDGAGFWHWKDGAITSDESFPSYEAAEADWLAWQELYSQQHVRWGGSAMTREPMHHDKPMQARPKGETFLGKGIE